MPMGEMEAAAIDAMLMDGGAGGDPFAALEGGGGQIRCQACQLMLDADTGAPVESVTADNVAALQSYEASASEAMFSGQTLELEGGGAPMPGGF